MRSSDRLHGTAIVIWMGRSIFDQPHTSRSPKNIRPKATVKTKKLEIEKQRERRLVHLEQLRNTAIDKLILVDLSVGAEVNYSLLHNDRQLLTKLTLTKLVEGPLEDIAYMVELYVGAESYPYRQTIEVLNEVQLALASEVMIPLTARPLARLARARTIDRLCQGNLWRAYGLRGDPTCYAHPGR